MRVLAAAVAAAVALAGAGRGAPALDPAGASWRDDFTDLSGVAVNQQGALYAPTGFSVDTGLQVWSQPAQPGSGFTQAFSAAPAAQVDPGIVIENPGSAQEDLTLWSQRIDPTIPLIASECEVGPLHTCPTSPPPNGGNGWMQNGFIATQAIIGIPYEQGRELSAAAWDADNKPLVINNTFTCAVPQNGFIRLDDGTLTNGIGSWLGMPIFHNVDLSILKPGLPYSFSFLVAAHIGVQANCTATPYLLVQLQEKTTLSSIVGGTYLGATIYEGMIQAPSWSGAGSNFAPAANFSLGAGAELTPVDLFVSSLPAIPGAVWDPQVWSLVGPRNAATGQGYTHCTAMGPVYVTAARGKYQSPVLDSLGDCTCWKEMDWDIDMATLYFDSAASAIPKGSPIAPVRLTYQVGSNPATLPTDPYTGTIWHGGETISGVIGLGMVMTRTATLTSSIAGCPMGRYFQYDAVLHNRDTAAELDPDLAGYPTFATCASCGGNPQFTPGGLYWGALRPIVHRITVKYFACAARVTSKPITPPSVKAWGQVTWTADRPAGTTLTVDVLARDGTVLLAGANSGDSLAGLDPFQYPSLVLRATLNDDPTGAKRPVLLSWGVTWTPLGDVVQPCRNSFRPDRGETLCMEIQVLTAGHVRVVMHDAAGQLVRLLLDEDAPAEARFLTWDGRNERGERVAPGVYFITVRVPGGRKVARVAVIR